MQADNVIGLDSSGVCSGHPTGHALSWSRLRTLGAGMWLALWLGIGMALRMWSFSWFQLREDEALYAYWARLISSGQDPMLERVAVDKPPFFIYSLANFFTWFGPSIESGRILNLLVSLLALLLLWVLARRIYGPRIARWALVLFALSPFAIVFAPTLYTDPMLVVWLLLALLLAAYGFGLGAGLALGMAFATKQNALLFAPLILGALALGRYPGFWRRALARISARVPSISDSWANLLSFAAFATGFYFVWFKVWQWDGWRILPAEIPSFWEQSWNSYGGLSWLGPSHWPGRMAAWWEVWRWLGGSTAGTLLLVGFVGMAVGVAFVTLARTDKKKRSSRESDAYKWDILFAAFITGYLILHVVVGFQPWDRYLLGLAPLLALLAARGLIFAWDRLAGHGRYRLALAVLVAALVLLGAGKAATGRIPVGGDHGAYSGIEQVTAYLQRTVPARKGVIYQRWLGWHWNWYLWDSPAGRVYWADPAMLIEDLSADPTGYARFVVFPAWHLDEVEALEAALLAQNLCLQERLLVRGGADLGQRFVVYQIVPRDGP